MLYQTKNPHGGDIYSEPICLDFSSNTNPFGTAPAVVAAVRQALTQAHHYPDPYCRELVSAIGKHEGVSEADILCGNGAAELIYSYCEAVKPKTALELAPTFSEYALGAERHGCIVDRYFLNQGEDFALDGQFLDYVRRTKPEVIFLCNPNNPTGRLIPQELLGEILDLCKRFGIRLFLDECFLDFTESGRSLKGEISGHPALFILKAFTKNYAMAGIRLGYGMCSDHGLLSQMASTVQPWNVSLLAQAAGAAALQDTEFLQRAKTLIAEQRPRMQAELERLGFRVCPSDGNFLLFYGREGLDRMLRKQGIAIRNCENYHGLSAGWYRAAVRLTEENKMLTDAIAQVCGKEQAWQKTL